MSATAFALMTPQVNTQASLTPEQRKQATAHITLWGVAVNLLLAALKIVGGIFGHSQALLADGLHSLSDLASDGMVLLAAKHAGEDADEDHPYGHARYETLATVALGFLLIGVAVGIGFDAVSRFNSAAPLPVPHLYTLIIAGASIVSKEALYHATARVARRLRSNMLEANAWHHRSDAISSIVVLIGIAGAWYGHPLLDTVAALIVAVMIARIGATLARESVQELVDTALEPERIAQIRDTILSVDDVQQLHMLRTRRMGHNALVDVHIQVAPHLSVSEGHHISEKVEDKLKSTFEEINDVTVHIDPEDDETRASCSHLPLRSELMASLQTRLEQDAALQRVSQITLHYLDGRVNVDAAYPLAALDNLDQARQLQQRFAELCREDACIGDCRLLFT